MSYLPGSELFSLTLADLGALMRGTPEAESTGKIRMNIEQDEVKTVLSADGVQQILRSYSVVGKVLATGLVDYERLQNQFLISCASMGNQLLRIYDLGAGADGGLVELTPERISVFFFDILHGKIPVSIISGEFNLASIVNNLGPTLAAPKARESVAEPGERVEQTSPQTPVADVTETAVQPSSALPVAQEAESPEPQTQTSDPEVAAPMAEGGAPNIVGIVPEEAAKSICKHCGVEADEGSSFCENCGQSLN